MTDILKYFISTSEPIASPMLPPRNNLQITSSFISREHAAEIASWIARRNTAYKLIKIYMNSIFFFVEPKVDSKLDCFRNYAITKQILLLRRLRTPIRSLVLIKIEERTCHKNDTKGNIQKLDIQKLKTVLFFFKKQKYQILQVVQQIRIETLIALVSVQILAMICS